MSASDLCSPFARIHSQYLKARVILELWEHAHSLRDLGLETFFESNMNMHQVNKMHGNYKHQTAIITADQDHKYLQMPFTYSRNQSQFPTLKDKRRKITLIFELSEPGHSKSVKEQLDWHGVWMSHLKLTQSLTIFFSFL